MAASPLADIDWTNLDSAEMTTAVRLLCVATQERFNIGLMRMDGTFFNTTANHYFPYGSNTPIWSLDDYGGPLANFSTYIETLITDCTEAYADIEKWDDADTNSENSITRFTLDMAADAPGTYDNRLFELIGDTTNTYPDLSVYAPEEVKKWYDMIILFEYVIRQHGEGENDDYTIFDGSFDVEQAASFAADEDGANFFGIDEVTYEAVSNTTPYSDFKTEQNALFGTTPDSYDTSTGSGTYPPAERVPFHIRVARLASNGNYVSWTKCWQATYVADWVDSRAAVGFNGRPVSYKNQQYLAVAEGFPTGEDPTFIYPGSTTADSQRYYTSNVVTEVSDRDEIAVDHDLSAVTVPTNITDISGGESVEVSVTQDTRFFNYFLEFWNDEGGFDNYT